MNTTAPKVVLVTGASTGIGKCCADHLVSRGYRVFGTSRRPPASTAPSSASVEMIAMDVDDDRSVTTGVQSVVEKAGRLDAVINNAGWGLMGAIEDTAIDEARAQLETNFFGVLRVCRAVLPILRQQGGGHIINISSLGGIVGLPFSGLYSASKFALEGFSEALRLETWRFGIRVVLVEPGDFRSNFTAARRMTKASAINDAYRQALDRAHAAQEKEERNGPTPEPIARLVEKILRSNNPRLRYTAGMLSQRMVVPLKRFLPQRFFEWLFCRVMGID
jgi:NAD(P)-dependent dehydrogenase (short-subunit alcohol dehydrogenase family)